MTGVAKPSRLAVRLTEEQDALIRHAARVEGKSITDFAVASAVEHAAQVLADRRTFPLGAADWTEFTALLDRPVARKPRLAALLSQQSVFDN